MTDVQIKDAGIKNWETNLALLKTWTQDRWDAWASIHPDERESAYEKRQLLSMNGEDGVPCIFGNRGHCAYCQNYSCEECPLNDLSESDRNTGVDCCYAWDKVFQNFIEKPYTLSAAIKSFEDMLKYIQEKG